MGFPTPVLVAATLATATLVPIRMQLLGRTSTGVELRDPGRGSGLGVIGAVGVVMGVALGPGRGLGLGLIQVRGTGVRPMGSGSRSWLPSVIFQIKIQKLLLHWPGCSCIGCISTVVR